MARTNTKSGSSGGGKVAPASSSRASRAQPGLAAASATVAFTGDVEVALTALLERRSEVIGPVELARVARLRSAVAELRACAEQVADDGLVVVGSMGQQRPHPLLKLISDLRREVAGGLKELDFDLEASARVEQANRLFRERGRMETKEAAALVVDLITNRDAGAEPGG
jgi:hypothetical protein